MYVISRNITPRRAHICIYDVDATKKTICYAVGKVIYFIVQSTNIFPAPPTSYVGECVKFPFYL